MKKLMAITFVVCISALTGCSGLQSAIDSYGTAAADSAVTSAEWTLCEAAPVGMIRKKYGEPDRAEAWRRLCSDNQSFTPVDGASFQVVNP